MALSTNQVSGLVSGFDWRSMIDQLMEIEHRRVDLVENTKSDYESQLEEWQSVNSKLLALKTSAENLKDVEDFKVFTATLSTDSASVDADDLIDVSTSTDASEGLYTIRITNIAKAQKLSSNPFTSKTSELGSSYAGDIIINGKVINISSTDSLTDVANFINMANTGADPIGVTASVIGYGSHDYRLILTSDSTGSDGITLLNGSSKNLIQKFGWKDSQTPSIKNSITNGAQSDRFTAQNVAIKSLLGLSTGESSTGTLTIDGTAVSINLSTQSLTDIKDAINSAMVSAGKGDQVVASVVSEVEDGVTYYRLQIEGTESFTDENNILNTLGILDYGSSEISSADTEVSTNSMTTNGEYITPDTLLVDIDGYISYTAGDNIQMSGTKTGGGAVSYTFNITSTTTVQDLLDAIETQYATNSGDVIAYVTSDGKIRVEDVAGGGSLDVILADNISNGQLEFVDGDGSFVDGTARQREIVAGEDATVSIDGVEVTDSSNILDDVIEGVTLNLKSEDASTTITLQISHDIDAIKEKIQDLVDKYNDIMGYINTQFSFDEEDESPGGVLFGDGTLRSVKNNLVDTLLTEVWGVDSDFASLSNIGIENQENENGQWELTIDDDTLTSALENNFNEVVSLFVGQGTTSSSSLSYLTHTRYSEAGQYSVHIYRAATRGTETGNVDLSTGGADETLTITQGDNTAAITITNSMSLDDIINEINQELSQEYSKVIVGDQQLTSGGSYITSETKWSDIDGVSLSDNDVISFTGTTRDGTSVSGSYTISDVSSDTVQGLLSAIEDAFSSEVYASIDTNGRIVVSDKYVGPSDLSIEITEPVGSGLDFGTIDVTAGAGDGSREGRYSISVTATDDGNNHLVLRSDSYGSVSFTISQDTSDNNYDHIIYTNTSNTTVTSNGNVYITSDTTWDEIYGANVSNGDTITISGKARDGTTDISGTYTITDISTDTVNGLLTAIESAYSAQGTTVDAFIRDGKIYVEDLTSGSSSISLTLTCNNEGGGSLDLGVFNQSTERDLDLGLINGTVTGQDVAGTIGGESATGSGQVLTGASGNASTEGLSVYYTGSSNNVDAGSVTLTVGVAELFERILFNMTDSASDGYVAYKQDSLQERINELEEQITEMEARLDMKMESMVNRFVNMELALSKIQNQSSWLSSQIQAVSSGWK